MWYTKNSNQEIILYIKVTPNAKHNKLLGIVKSNKPHLLKIAVASPPKDGAANKQLIFFLSKTLNIAKSKIHIIKGLTSCTKVIIIKATACEKILNSITSILEKDNEQHNQLFLI